jgi:hypothetical protein
MEDRTLITVLTLDAKSFPNVSDEDSITLVLGPASNPGVTELVLRSTNSVNWWKGIELRRKDNDKLIAGVFTQNSDRGPKAMTVPVHDLWNVRVYFLKAKAFGIRTRMYEIRDLSGVSGQRLDLTWETDVHRNGPVVGFFADLGSTVSELADATATLVEETSAAVGTFVADLTETIGHAAGDAITTGGQVLGNSLGPPAGADVSAFAAAVGSGVAGASTFIANTAKAGFDGFGKVVAGGIRMVGGVVALDGELFLKGAGDVIFGFTGAAVVIGGTYFQLLQSPFVSQRPLLPSERDLLRRVYRDSLLLRNIRICPGVAGIFGLSDAPFTLGNTIYLRNSAPIGSLLVHEAAHVWQFQNLGSHYTVDALWAMATDGRNEAYDWKKQLALGKQTWIEFNAESQAALVEDIWESGRRYSDVFDADGNRMPLQVGASGDFYENEPVGNDVVFEASTSRGAMQDFTAFARDTVNYIRGFRPRGLSRVVENPYGSAEQVVVVID